MKKLLIALILLSSPAFAVREYYGISRSIRSLGMGGAFYALSDDEYALFYNPAGLSLLRNEGEFKLRINSQASFQTLSALKTFTNISNKSIGTVVTELEQYEGTPLYGQVGLLPFYYKKNFAVGLLIADTKVDFALLGKQMSTVADLTAISDSGLVLGYGNSFFNPNLHLGMNLKALYRGGGRTTYSTIDIAANQTVSLDPKTIGGTGAGVDFDLGATYELPSLPFGVTSRASIVLSNLLATNFPWARIGSSPPALSRTLSLGWYTVFDGWSFVDNFHVLVDFSEFNLGGETDPDKGHRGGSFFKKLNWGVEMPVGMMAIRAGVHQGYLTAGFGVNFKFLRLDLATYGEELGDAPGRQESRRFALTLAIGGGSPTPPPISSRYEVPVTESDPTKSPAIQDGKMDPALDLSEPAKNANEGERKPQSSEPAALELPIQPENSQTLE